MITYTKLNSGDWGLRGTTAELQAGATVTVTRRAGGSQRLLVGKIVWTGQGTAIATIDRGNLAPMVPVATVQTPKATTATTTVQSADKDLILINALMEANRNQLLMIRQIVENRLAELSKAPVSAPATIVAPVVPQPTMAQAKTFQVTSAIATAEDDDMPI